MIDKEKGHIIISDAIRIKPNDLKQDILSLNLGQARKELDYGNGWSWVQVGNAFIDKKYFVLSFGFFENRLKEISFCVSDTKFDLNNTWETWSQEKELAYLEEYQAWLANELGTQRNFEWGTVSAFYDQKGGSSFICLRYTS
jgi:hypothetical protein